MSEDELEGFKRLLEYYGTDITTRQALDALWKELEKQQSTNPYWRFKQVHKFKTAWAEMWPGGRWITARVGDGEQARRMRELMSEAELEEFNRLLEHYGTTSRRVRLWMR